MKTGFNGAGGVGGSSLRRCRRLRQDDGKVKMAFDTSSSGGDGREGGAASASMSGVGIGVSVGSGGGSCGSGGSGRGGLRR
jgi:hypothetical protein